MVMTRILAIVAAASLLGACDRPLSNPEKGAALGAAAGTGIGLVTGGSFGTVVGAGQNKGADGNHNNAADDSSRR